MKWRFFHQKAGGPKSGKSGWKGRLDKERILEMKMSRIILSNKIAFRSTSFSRVLPIQVCSFQVLFSVFAPSHVFIQTQPGRLLYGGDEEWQSCFSASQFTTVACTQGDLIFYPYWLAENKCKSLVLIYTMICMTKLIYLKWKLWFMLKDGCFSNWNGKNSPILETERVRLFTLYLFDFTVVILHPVFQLCLSVAHIRAHCMLVMYSCLVNGLMCAHILILVSKICVCDIMLHELQE